MSGRYPVSLKVWVKYSLYTGYVRDIYRLLKPELFSCLTSKTVLVAGCSDCTVRVVLSPADGPFFRLAEWT